MASPSCGMQPKCQARLRSPNLCLLQGDITALTASSTAWQCPYCAGATAVEDVPRHGNRVQAEGQAVPSHSASAVHPKPHHPQRGTGRGALGPLVPGTAPRSPWLTACPTHDEQGVAQQLGRALLRQLVPEQSLGPLQEGSSTHGAIWEWAAASVPPSRCDFMSPGAGVGDNTQMLNPSGPHRWETPGRNQSPTWGWGQQRLVTMASGRTRPGRGPCGSPSGHGEPRRT